MDVEFTAEQQALKDAVRRFCQEKVSAERLAEWELEPRGIDAKCWRQISELGWLGLGAPVGAGGSGLGLVEVACVLQECARGLIPRAVIGAIRGVWALGRLDPDAPELAGLVTGASTVTLALDEERARNPAHYETRLERANGIASVHGAKWCVANGGDADWQIVAAREGEECVLGLVAGEGTKRANVRTFDGERQAAVEYAGVPVVRELSQPGKGREQLEVLQREQVALGLAEMLGGMDMVLEMTVAYVKEREQFGSKIAVFQAVQHQVSDMATDLTAARHLVWQAITRLAAGSVQGVELETAAVFAGRAFKRVSLSGMHLHGGAGYVIEHPLHYHAERAQGLCIRYAPADVNLAAVARSLLD